MESGAILLRPTALLGGKRRNGIAPYGLVPGPATDAACCPTQPVEGRVRLKLDAEPAWSVVP